MAKVDESSEDIDWSHQETMADMHVKIGPPHSSLLATRLRTLRNMIGPYTDVSITCGSHITLNVHRSIVCQKSESIRNTLEFGGMMRLSSSTDRSPCLKML